MLWWVFALKCFVFQNFNFSRISIDRTCCSTIEIMIKILVWIYFARLMLDRSNVIFDRLNLFSTDQKSFRRVFKNISFSRVPHYFKTFQKDFWLSTFDRSSSSDFLSFSLKFFMHLKEVFELKFWASWCSS